MNMEFEMTLTLKDDNSVFGHSLRMPVHLKEDLTVKLVLMQNSGSTTSLLFSKNARPNFAQKKNIAKLRLLVG